MLIHNFAYKGKRAILEQFANSEKRQPTEECHVLYKVAESGVFFCFIFCCRFDLLRIPGREALGGKDAGV